jgi:ERF superfamily protein
MNAPDVQLKDLPALPSDSVSLIHMIAQAARDPSIDINKFERLMEMHERLTAREAEKAFNAAMTACQLEMKQIATDAENPQTRSRYATYAKLDAHLRPIYTRHGFALSFDEGESKPDSVRVVCIVSHVAGHSRSYHRDIPADGKGAKGGDVMTKTHAAGAAGSYGARYLLRGIFNVAIGELDNDGNGAGGMEDGKIADHLAAIDAVADAEALKKAFAVAWKAAEAANWDKYAMKKFAEHRDAKRKALGAKP